MYRIALIVLFLPLTACAQETDSTAAPAAKPDTAFVEACMAQTNMGQSICTCTARKARAELSESGYLFLLATLTEDDEAAAEHRSKMELQETIQAGMFLVNAPRECAGDGS